MVKQRLGVLGECASCEDSANTVRRMEFSSRRASLSSQPATRSRLHSSPQRGTHGTESLLYPTTLLHLTFLRAIEGGMRANLTLRHPGISRLSASSSCRDNHVSGS